MLKHRERDFTNLHPTLGLSSSLKAFSSYQFSFILKVTQHQSAEMGIGLGT
jgi:hypothetical protein